MSPKSHASPRFSRRIVVGSSLAGATIAPFTTSQLAAARLGVTHLAWSQDATPATDQGETTGGPVTWRMWLLGSVDELRPEAPGDPTQAEIDEVVAAQAAVTDETAAVIARWGTGPAVVAWSQLAVDLLIEFDIGGMAQGRFMAIYHTALHDAAIAAWDAQVASARPGPAATSDQVTPAAGVNPDQPSFPSEHAAVAGAAAATLAYLLPDAEPGRFDALAMEAAESRLAAGAAFRSDIDAGLALGQAVGAQAVTRAQGDGSDAEWDPSTMPTGPGIWQPTPPGFVETPINPLAGTWQTWVMTSGDQVRPAPPPEYGSPAWEAELKAVQEIAANRTFEQERLALWWGSASPAELCNGWTLELIGKSGVDGPHAAQILADLHVAIADAAIAIWDAKFTWWTARPITEDPTLETLLPAPPYPSYTSGYSGLIGAGTTVIGKYFPDVADDMAVRAAEAAASRGWAGIHYVIDDDIGLAMGRQVGRLVCALPGTTAVEDA